MQPTDEILEVLRSCALRLTKTRKALIELFSRHETPLSVPDILHELKRVRIDVNKTTVYRELERLGKLGIVETVRLDDRKRYYELVSRGHHHHLVCLRCDQVADIDVNEQALFAEERTMNREQQFTILRHSLEFFGLCRSCQISG
ncbi:MAG: Fur family transcriptional regulator [Candidatus Moraniibacteriota bacterium]